jgi:hypothetical protein
MKLRNVSILLGGLLVLLTALMPKNAQAHQPYCEFADATPDSPWQVPDSSISYAYYGNLYPAGDVDFYTFDANEGQSVLLSLSIPAIEGQEDFAPVMVVYGPGVDGETLDELPESVSIPDDQGAMMVALGDEPVYWYEPFGGRYYWNWEDTFFEAPEDATYTVALWHPEDELGRYSFVVGEEEVRGGDQDCSASFDDYWTPLVAGENPYRDGGVEMDMAGHMHKDGMDHDHGKPMELDADGAPVVDLQVIPLDDGGYNVRVQTMNFIFAPHNVGMDPAEGEGHAHLYVDGVKVARVYGEWFHLESLLDGAEMVSVGLYANNHQPLSVDGDEIMDMVMLGDEMASMQ